MKSKILLVCTYCKNNFYRDKARYNKTLKTNQSGNYYCSYKCSGLSRVVQNTKHLTEKGYIRIFHPDFPYDGSRWVMEHDLIIAKKIGRKLYKDERIHHLNGIKTDNRPENLQLLNSSSHSTIHNLLEYKKPFTKLGFKKNHKLNNWSNRKRDSLGHFI